MLSDNNTDGNSQANRKKTRERVANPRKHGHQPYRVIVAHGGPGALGSVGPVARELSSVCGTLEPFQTAETLDKQVTELELILNNAASAPVTLIGHSWGAWLCTIIAAARPGLVRKLIIVGSGPFESHYAEQIMPTRLARIAPAERERCGSLMRELHASNHEDKRAVVERLGDLLGRTDDFDPLPPEPDPDGLEADLSVFAGLFEEADALRRSGELLEIASRVRCPVVAIHGDYDPHPAEGVVDPLTGVVADFRFVLLSRCGHHPWNERWARDEFFEILKSEVA